MDIPNLHHLFKIYKIVTVLSDTNNKNNIKVSNYNVKVNTLDFTDIPNDPNSSVYVDYISQLLLESNIKESYDLLICDSENINYFIPFMHRSVFIFTKGKTTNKFLETVYSKISDCFDGQLYVNNFHSIIFDKINLTIHEQSFIRDKPLRFLNKTLQLLESFVPLPQDRIIVEIGTCRNAMTHPLTTLNPICCNDGHSTFFWCTLKNTKVYTVDINPNCERILIKAYKDKQLVINGSLQIHTGDGIEFLQDFVNETKNDSSINSSKTIDLLFLDAWDVVEGTSFAEKHLEAYNVVKNNLNDTCFISIDDTDIANGGKGKLVVPQLIKDGFTILYKGRHTVLVRRLHW